MVDHFLKGTTNKEDDLVAYCYCKRDPAQPERAEPEEILRAILRQLAFFNDFTFAAVLDIFLKKRQIRRTDGSSPSRLTVTECVDLILLCTSQNRCVIIIDGLDECNPVNRNELLSGLNTIADRGSSSTKLFLSSRDNRDIVQRLGEFPNIFVDRTKNSSDIERFIKTRVDHLISEKVLLYGLVGYALREKIIEKLTDGAQGMYVESEFVSTVKINCR